MPSACRVGTTQDAHEGDHGQPEVRPPQVPEPAHLADLHHAHHRHDDDGAQGGLRQRLEERRQEQRHEGRGRRPR